MKVAVYCRVSKEDQNPENQEIELKEYANNRDFDIFKVYTERFEQRLSYDVHHLYDTIERFFNMYKHYKVVSKVAPFSAV